MAKDDKNTRKLMIEELNKDLEWEYAAAVQYVQHAAVLTGPQYEGVIKELLIHANEELAHAVSVANQIAFLGGVPSIQVEKIETADKARAILKMDLRGEENAIRRYKERIAQAEALGEYGLRRVLEDILMQEEEHKRDIMTALDQ